ncbi:MAG: transcriptional repressor LexA [Desulfobacterales bacterium]|nr:transcriptional repressor LexA [Desulfobacterales bacterium]
MKLTQRQEEILMYIRSHQEKLGMTPTVREICTHFDLNGPAGVHRILHVLVEKGHLMSTAGKKRSWRIPGLSVGKTIPLVGRIAAGTPILAIENREDELPVNPSMFASEMCFALRIQGDSMIEAHIMDGDLAIIRPQNNAENGQIVAVIVENILHEATLKILRKTKSTLELHSANRAYPPLVFSGRQRQRVRIVGKLAGIIRRNN